MFVEPESFALVMLRRASSQQHVKANTLQTTTRGLCSVWCPSPHLHTPPSIHRAPTGAGATPALDLVFFDRELVVVAELLPGLDFAGGREHLRVRRHLHTPLLLVPHTHRLV